VIHQLQLRRDVCLVLLAPNPAVKSDSGLILAPGIVPPVCYGRVIRTGPAAIDVATGDLVAFPPSAGDPFEYRDFELLFIREREIAFVVNPKEES
jgi:co-chaperonin GroES (HSP10)